MDDKLLREYYGTKYQKVMTDRIKVKAEMVSDFSKKYPGADMTKFTFEATFNKDGTVGGRDVFFRIDDVESYDIKSDTFRNNSKWTWYLYQWEKVWNPHGTKQDLVTSAGTLPYTINDFSIYVTDTAHFDSELPALVTTWRSSGSVSEDTNFSGLKFDYENNPYFASILAAYLTTYACGVSTVHLRGSPSTPKIITSMARYHLYYHMSRFLRDPSRMTKYIPRGLLKELSDSLPKHDVPIMRFYQFSGGAPNINV